MALRRRHITSYLIATDTEADAEAYDALVIVLLVTCNQNTKMCHTKVLAIFMRWNEKNKPTNIENEQRNGEHV